MLNIQGTPSRGAILTQIRSNNLHLQCGQEMSDLFLLIEEEKKPLKISQNGFKLVKKICENSDFAKYEQMLLQVVAIRFLQKLRNFYTSVKMENLHKYLKDFGDE